MAIPHKCPVCEGRGMVGDAFYGGRETSSCDVPCRSCDGSGIIWELSPTPGGDYKITYSGDTMLFPNQAGIAYQ